MLTNRFEEALIYATRLHAQQLRKGSGVPYIAHLLAVTSLALEHGADEDTALAALLHDAIEDQGGAATRAEIQRRFGDVVVAIVEGCTDADVMPKPPWRARKEAYLARLPKEPEAVRLVSVCDKLHNARCLLTDLRIHGEAVWQRFNGGREGTIWYYRSLVSIYRQTGTVPALTEELARTLAEIECLSPG
jgi:(p)ppGpp synthase/HD superfamily hydrolase